MAITVSQGSKEVVTRLIRTEFDNINWHLEFIYGKADKLIKTAKEFGLCDLADELENDKKVA